MAASQPSRAAERVARVTTKPCRGTILCSQNVFKWPSFSFQQVWSDIVFITESWALHSVIMSILCDNTSVNVERTKLELISNYSQEYCGLLDLPSCQLFISVNCYTFLILQYRIYDLNRITFQWLSWSWTSFSPKTLLCALAWHLLVRKPLTLNKSEVASPAHGIGQQHEVKSGM